MAGSAVVGTLKALLVADTVSFDRAMARSKDTLNVWSAQLKKTGEQATALGTTLTKSLTLPLATLGLGALKMATDFESGFANVRKTVQATEPEFAALTATIRGLAKTIPIATDELNKIAALGGQMGVPTAQLGKFTETIALLGVAIDGISTEEAASSLAQIGNAAGIGTKDVDKMASALVYLGNNSAATEGQILEFTKRLVGAGTSIGLTVPEVMALGTAMANVGINAEAGGSAMSKVLSDMSKAVSKGGDDLKAFAQVAEMSSKQFAETFRAAPMAAIEAFIKGLGTMKARGVDLNLTMGEIGETGIRVEDTLKRLAGGAEGLTKAVGDSAIGWQSANKHIEEAREKFKTTENQLKTLWQQIKDVGITIGNAMLPAVNLLIRALSALTPWIDRLAKFFAALPAPVQLLAIGLGVLAAAAGPLLVLFGQIVFAAGNVTAAFAAQGIATRALATAQTALGLTSTTLRGMLPLLSTALLGVGAAALYAFTEIGKLKEKEQAWAAEMAERTRLIEAANKVLGEGVGKQIDFSKWTRTQRDDLLAAGAAAKDTKFSFSGLNEEFSVQIIRTDKATKATEQHTAAVTLSEEEQKKAAEAAKRYAEAIRDLADSFTKKKVNEEVKRLTAAVLLLQQAAEKADWSKLIAAIEDLEQQGGTLTPTLQRVKHQFDVTFGPDTGPTLLDQLTADARTFRVELDRLSGPMASFFDDVRLFQNEAVAGDVVGAVNFLPRSALFESQFDVFGNARVENQRIAFEQNQKATEQALAQVRAWAETFGRIIGGLWDEVSGGITDLFTQALSGAVSFSDAFENVWLNLERKLANIFADILNLFVNGLLRGMIGYLMGNQQAFAQAFGGLAGTGAQSLMGTALGVGTGTAVGGIGTPVALSTVGGTAAGGAAAGGLGSAGALGAVAGSVAGAGAGGAVGYFVGYKSGSTAKGAAAGAGTGAGVGFALGGPIGAGVGAGVGALAGWYGAVKAGKKINDIRDAFAESQGGMEAIEARLTSMGRADLWKPFAFGERNIDKFKEALGDIQEAFEKADQAAKQLAEDQATWMRALETGFGKLTTAAEKYGTVLPKSLRDTIGPLLESKDLTADMRAQLSGLAADPSWRTLQGIAEKYGIALEGLGAKFQKARITDIALEYARDWQVLIDGGADLTAVVSGAADELNALYRDAKNNGVALPDTLKPYFEKLIELGLLVDGDGQKITNLNGITFEDIEDKLLTQVVDVLKEIAQLLRDGLPQAAEEGVEKINDAFGRIRPPNITPVGGAVPRAPGPSGPGPSGPGEPDPGPIGGNRNPDPGLGMWGGTHGQYVDWGAGTAVTLHGKEAVVPEGAALGGGEMRIVLQQDGKTTAEWLLPFIPGAARRLGLAGVY